MKRIIKSLGLVAAAAVLWFTGSAHAADRPGLRYPTHQIAIAANGTTAGTCEDGVTSAAVSTTTSGTVGVSVSGTWTGTLAFYINLGNFGYTQIASTSSNGTWTFPVGGAQTFCVAFNTSAATGTALVILNSTPAATSAVGSVSASGSLNGTAATILPISGTQWATARFAFAGTLSTQTLEFDYTIDGTNWIASGQGAPYVKRVDAVSSNPSVVFGSTATVGGQAQSFNISTYGASTWELPLAANVQAVRLLPLSTGAGTVTITAGLPTGTPVAATLLDVTSAINTAISLTADVSGWGSLLTFYSCGTGLIAAAAQVDDSGSTTAGIWQSAVSAYGLVSQTRNGAVAGIGSGLLAGTPYGFSIMPRRQNWATTASAGVMSRFRVEASR